MLLLPTWQRLKMSPKNNHNNKDIDVWCGELMSTQTSAHKYIAHAYKHTLATEQRRIGE